MKITANRRDDIIKRRDEYDTETNRLEEVDKAADQEYGKARLEAMKAIETKVSEMIGSTTLNLDIRANPGWLGSRGWEIDVHANEFNKFDDNVALAWNWEIGLDSDGNIRKDSGSWSGLKVITTDQIADLEESVRVLKILNNADWSGIVDAPTVDYYKYHDKDLQDQIRDRRKARPDFESELQAAALEDYIGGNVALKLKQDQYYKGSVWILPTGLTDKFIKGYIFSEWTAQNHGMNADEIRQSVDERRSARTNLVKDGSDFVTMELN